MFRSSVCLCRIPFLLAVVACGGEGSAPDGGAGGRADAQDGPSVISSVTISGRGVSTQVRQGEAGADVVITGHGLAKVTAATLGDMTATVASTTDSSAHLTLNVPHGESLGTKTLTATTPGGSAVFNGALTVTPISVAMTGDNSTGAGTADMPWRTIRQALLSAAAGDVVHVSDGVYRSGEQLDISALPVAAGVRLEGQSMTGTIISSDLGAGATAATGVSVAGSLSRIRVSKFVTSCVTMSGTATLDHVQADGCNYGFYAPSTGTLVLDHIHATANSFVGVWLAPSGTITATLTTSELDANGFGSPAVSNGGLSATGGVTLSVDGCNIHNNSATASGMIVHVSGALTVRNTTSAGSGYGLTVLGNTYISSKLDLGTSNTAGNNTLGGSTYAVWDHRPALVAADGTVLTLSGTMLNGSSYTPQTITGPATNPTAGHTTDYFVESTNERIQF